MEASLGGIIIWGTFILSYTQCKYNTIFSNSQTKTVLFNYFHYLLLKLIKKITYFNFFIQKTTIFFQILF